MIVATIRRALALALTCLAACGGAPEPSGLAIAFSKQELLDQASRLAIYFYGGATACAAVAAQEPRPTSLVGPYLVSLDDAGRTSGVTFTVPDLPVGAYTVFIDALDAGGARVGSGCAPSQDIFDRQTSKIRITISP